ncbi:MAG: hypothetical protein ACFCVA_14230 [Gammaproteobacteria bacterium]
MSPVCSQELADCLNAFRSAAPEAVHAERIRLIYGNAPIGAVVSIVSGLIVAAVLWSWLPPPWAITWLIINSTVALAWLPMVWR